MVYVVIVFFREFASAGSNFWKGSTLSCLCVSFHPSQFFEESVFGTGCLLWRRELVRWRGNFLPGMDSGIYNIHNGLVCSVPTEQQPTRTACVAIGASSSPAHRFFVFRIPAGGVPHSLFSPQRSRESCCWCGCAEDERGSVHYSFILPLLGVRGNLFSLQKCVAHAKRL